MPNKQNDVFLIVGDPVVRPQSEFKVSTPVDKPPSAPLSAPPNVIEQAKMEGTVFSFYFFYSQRKTDI